MIRLGLLAVALAAMLAGAALAQSARWNAPAPAAVLRGLDKITGQAKDFTAPVGRAVTFGSLSITVRACRSTPPEERPETAVYLEVRTAEAEADAEPLLKGWIFASSPGIHALEHPVYDVWAIRCKT